MAQGNITIPVRPELEEKKKIYERIKILLENDEKGYATRDFCLDFPNEPRNARAIRCEHFVKSFRNITLDLIGAPSDAIFKEHPRLEFDNPNSPLAMFSEDVTMGGDVVPLLQFAKDFSCIALRAYGQVWTVIDKPDYEAASYEQELLHGMPYIQNINPLQVLNWETDADGFIWFAYWRDRTALYLDPLGEIPDVSRQIVIWTREEIIVIESGNVIRRDRHNLGLVPVVTQALFLPPDEDSIVGVAPFFTSSAMIIYANNLMSVPNLELIKHGTSVLLVHQDAVSQANHETDENGVPVTKLQDADRYNEYVWNGDHAPEYLTKDLDAVEKGNMQADMYFRWAIDNEKTMRSVMKKGATANDLTESGIAKQFDAMPVLAGLRSTSEDLESWTNKVLVMIGRIFNMSDDQILDSYTLEYPKSFDVAQRTMTTRLEEIEKMITVNYPSETGMKEAFKALTPMITTKQDTAELMTEEIDEAPDKAEELRAEVAKELQDAEAAELEIEQGGKRLEVEKNAEEI